MANKKKYAKGLGGLKVVHSDGDQEFAKTRYFATEPGHYKPPAQMVLGNAKAKQEPEPPEPSAPVEVDQAIQDAIDRQLELETESTPTKDEADAIKKRMRRGRGQTFMGGGMVKYGMGGRVSSGKGCGIATSGRKFSGTF